MPLTRFAASLFGDPAWPQGLTVPQAWIEFEVDDIEAATRELEDGAYDLLVRAREEPWGRSSPASWHPAARWWASIAIPNADYPSSGSSPRPAVRCWVTPEKAMSAGIRID